MKKRMIFILTLLTFILHSGNIFAQSMCELSERVAKEGLEVFKFDKEKGIKLLEKAKRLCRSNVSIFYNLGIAYHSYGNLAESEKNFRAALKKKSHDAYILNNLAWVILQRGKDPEEALRLAKKSLSIDVSNIRAHDTLVRAMFASGRYPDTLNHIRKLEKEFGRSGEIRAIKKEITGRYVSHYAGLVNSGRTDEGLWGLKAGGGHKDIARMHCLVLLRLGREEQALRAAEAAMARFGNSGVFGDFADQALHGVIRGLYRDFENGDPSLVAQSAKSLLETHPGNPEVKKAHDQLFKAFLSDATKDIHIFRKRETPSRLTDDLLENIPKAKKKNRYGVALLIGNQRYAREKKGLCDVTFAERDVAVMKKYLEKTLGYDPKNILCELNVTSGEIRDLIGTDKNPSGRLHSYIRKGKSDLFVYYVGHGSPGPEGKSSYLIPVDSRVDFIQNNGYSLDTFYSILEKLPAKRMTVVLDACFSGGSANGPVFRNISPAMLKTASPIREISKTAIFCGAKKDQVSTWYKEKRHSLFTYFFLNGLKGAADSDKNRRITLLEMKKYLKKEVPYWAMRESYRKQDPLVSGNGKTVIAEFKR